MNQRIQELAEQCTEMVTGIDEVEFFDKEKFAELIIQEYAQEYQQLVNGDRVVVPKDRAHAEALVRVGMFYLEQNK